MCNFIDDCPEMDDEETCPPEFTFDICDTLEDCHWYEETPGDDLNFNIMKGMASQWARKFKKVQRQKKLVKSHKSICFS